MRQAPQFARMPSRAMSFAVASLASVVMACTQPTQEPTLNGRETESLPDGASQGGQALRQGAIPVQFDESMFKAYAVNTGAMSWQLEHADQRRAGNLTFTNGRATVEIASMPIGVTADLKFGILEAGVLKFYAVEPRVTLQQGTNQFPLRLAPIGGGAPLPQPSLIPIVSPQGPGPSLAPSPVPSAMPSIAPWPSPSVGASPGMPLPSRSPLASPQSSLPPPVPGQLSFARDIKPIFDRRCAECHHPGKPLDLSRPPFRADRDLAASVVSILTSISGSTATMPPRPRTAVPQNEIDLIRQWQAGGLLP